ncbi:MDR family MFS transporter [Ammoniphilus sp. 3BR4]|uniref:MDR family MFS transporter n=1 Tax=Ammoniphilus sp. 3BR4 TaxID=3158265 RepID=UPI003467917F
MEQLALKKKITIIIAIMSAMFFASLNMTIMGTSLPKIVAEIGGMEYFNWVFSIYMLTSSVTASLVGKLSDIYGRKIFILTGICIFMIGSLLSGFSQSISQLILFRGMQGAGGGMIMSSAVTTVGDLFSPRERGRWQGVMAGVMGVSSLIGPTVGGYIVDHMNWSWVFWIFLPIGLFAFMMILKLYPPVQRKEKEQIDYLGSFLLTLTILTFLLGLSWAGTEYAWHSTIIIGLFSCFFGFSFLFVLIENKVKSPVVPLFLFKNSVIILSYIVLFLFGMGMFGLVMYIPFYVQGVLGKSATISGLMEMVMTLCMVSFSTIAGQIITRTGKYKGLGLAGFFLMATGVFLNTRLTPETDLNWLVFYLVISGVGMGLTMPVYPLIVQNAVEHKYLGVATATSQLFRQMGATVGVSVMGLIMTTKMSQKLAETSLPGSMAREDLLNPQLLMSPHAAEEMKQKVPAELYPHVEQLLETSKEALNYALSEVFWFGTGMVVLAFILTLFLKEIPLRTSNEEDSQSAVDRIKRTMQG